MMRSTFVIVFAGVCFAPQAVAQGTQPVPPPSILVVEPGMTREQVVARLGAPSGVRVLGPRTFLFFRNGRERRAGTSDVVFLENDAVVDAIFRAPNRRYAGTSSFQPDVRPAPTNVVSVPAGDVPVPVESRTPPRGTTVLPSIVGSGTPASVRTTPAGDAGRPASATSAPASAQPSDTARRPQPNVPWQRPPEAGPPTVRQPNQDLPPRRP